LGITSDFEEGFGTGLQQQMVQDFLVLQGDQLGRRRFPKARFWLTSILLKITGQICLNV
jgi:hypothetical protein